MEKLLSYRPRRLYNDRPNPTFQAREWHRVINWGNGNHVEGLRLDGISRFVNPVRSVAIASNKLSTFRALTGVDGIRIPEFTTNREEALGWIRDKSVIVCRTKLGGHSGDGIVLANNESELVAAPLYVRYIKKQNEYRVHVAFGEVIDVQEKRKRRDLPEDFQANFQVRNHHTGWVYCREDIQLPTDAAGMAVKTCSQLGLDFGAVDIIYNAKRNESYVLEVNTAPGLEGTTVEKYAEVFVRELSK